MCVYSYLRCLDLLSQGDSLASHFLCFDTLVGSMMVLLRVIVKSPPAKHPNSEMWIAEIAGGDYMFDADMIFCILEAKSVLKSQMPPDAL